MCVYIPLGNGKLCKTECDTEVAFRVKKLNAVALFIQRNAYSELKTTDPTTDSGTETYVLWDHLKENRLIFGTAVSLSASDICEVSLTYF